MFGRDRRGLSWLLAALAAALTVPALVVDLRDGLTWRAFATGDPGFSVLLALTFPLLGAAVLHRAPGNRLGWVFALVGVSRAVFVSATAWTHHTYVVDPGSWPGGGVASWVAFWTRLPAVALAPLVLLWFPDGRPPAGRWRRAQWPSAVAAAATVGVAAASWPYSGRRLLPDAPTPAGTVPAIAQACFGVTAVAAVVGIVVGVAGLVARLRRADPVVGAQVRWYLYGGVVAVVLNLAGDFLAPRAGLNLAGTLASEVAILVAVERYRLWDVDRMINRTLVYGALTALAAGTYAGVAVALGVLFGNVAHGRSLAVAGGTLAAAALVAPARRGVQAVIDRWFDRRRFDAVARVRGYADRLGIAAPVPGELQTVLAEALRDPDLGLAFALGDGRLVDAAGNPLDPPRPGGPGRTVRRLTVGSTEIGTLTHRVVPPYERDLLEAVLTAAAGPLEHARLQAELRVQLAAVEASRVRIVEATDSERRRIERNLHDGAQQRLVALAAWLRTEQRRLGAPADPALTGMIDGAVDGLKEAVAELRTLAAGLLPAALASEGLGPALRELVDRQPGAARLATVPAHRHRPALEATGWFVAAEGLANALKHANGAPVTVAADCVGQVLTVTVTDTGPGGAVLGTGSGLRGLADRVDACGGRLVLSSPPAGGTDLRAELPCG